MSKRVLFVFSSADKTLTGRQTGYYLSEAAHPYYVLSPHFQIDFASPTGSGISLDHASKDATKDDAECVKFLQDAIVQEKFSNVIKLSEVDVAKYDAVFYPGGHGPAIDLPFDNNNTKVGNAFWRVGKITAAVCHGPAALTALTNLDGTSIFTGLTATGFTDEEEKLFGTLEDVPFLLESKMRQLGVKFEKADKPFGEKIVVSGRLITGENPASAKGVGEAILTALK